MSKFDAAIYALNRFSRKSFGYSEDETAQFHNAIRVLEAAGNFTADDLERITNTLDNFIEYTPVAGFKCPGRVLKDKFIALLNAIPALPDKEDKDE
jgi:hypothetical protein